MDQIKCHHQGLERYRVVISTTSSFNLPISPVQQVAKPLRMSVDYCKHNHVVILMAGFVPDAFSSLENIDT